MTLINCWFYHVWFLQQFYKVLVTATSFFISTYVLQKLVNVLQKPKVKVKTNFTTHCAITGTVWSLQDSFLRQVFFIDASFYHLRLATTPPPCHSDLFLKISFKNKIEVTFILRLAELKKCSKYVSNFKASKKIDKKSLKHLQRNCP